VILLPGQATIGGVMYAFGDLGAYTLEPMTVRRLRAGYPDFPRTYRGPGNIRIRGYDAPLFAIGGGAFTAVAFVVIAILNKPVALVGIGWLALGIAVYAAFRRRHGLDLTSTHKVAIPQPVVDHEAEYDSVLVPVSDGYDDHVMATATKLAARKRRGMHVVSFVTVPYSLPIDAPMREAEAHAESVIEQARVQGGRRVSGHIERIRPGQAGRRIVEEAIDMRAAAIVLALPRRVDGASLFGKTLETVLAERPCRVVIESTPPPASTQSRRRALEKAGVAP
jgi:APA family basic amino acid/polyamine antiporter